MTQLDQDCFISFELAENGFPVSAIPAYIVISDDGKTTITFHQNERNPHFRELEKFNLYGQTVKNEKFTFTGCYFQPMPNKFSSNALAVESYKITGQKLYLGDWIEDKDLQNIDKAYVRFSYLEYWIDTFDFNWDDDYNSFEVKNIKKKIESFDIDENCTLSTGSQYRQKIIDNKKLIFDTENFLHLTFKSKIEVKKVKRYIFILKNFFNIIIPNEKIFYEEIHFYTKNKSLELIEKQFHYTAQKSDSISMHSFLYNYHPNDIQTVLQKWFLLESKYGVLFDTLHTILEANNYGYIESEFIALVQWLEGFCRIKYPTNKAEVESFKLRVDSIVEELKNEEDKKFIKNITENKHETPFKKQLKSLFKDNSIKDLLEINSGDFDRLIQKIGNYRNQITHPNESQEYDLQKMIYLNRFIKNFIFIVFRNELELNEPSLAYDDIKRNLVFSYQMMKNNNAKEIEEKEAEKVINSLDSFLQKSPES
ncbi:MAG: hypothetical protein U9Q33_01510 [Campylobacterota bacterium]|nr:hypothetical protein [Campylobacterota bacterium]